MDKLLILNKIKEYYSFKNDTVFANFLGVSPQVLSNWKSRKTFDVELIYTKCLVFNSEWLLTGKGDMLKNKNALDNVLNEPMDSYGLKDEKQGIPLIPLSAMAGFGEGESAVLEVDCERFVVPTFKGADFLITVKGSSMQPKYNSGDIVACKKLPLNDLFFQWNKVYVLDTIQGALVKRIRKGSTEESVLIVSDNEKYEPFELHKSQINAVALVIGVIRLE